MSGISCIWPLKFKDGWITVSKTEDRLTIIQRQAQRVANGKKVIGRRPSADVDGHVRYIAQVRSIAEGVSYLSQELKRLLEVVVLNADARMGILTSQDRTAEIETMVCLLEELAVQAPEKMQTHLRLLTRHLSLAVPSLLLFARSLDERQHQACEQLGPQAISLLAWAWQRRKILVRARRNCSKVLNEHGRPSQRPCFMPGRRRCEPVVRWKTGTALCARISQFIARFQQGCSHCWRCGTIIVLLHEDLMKVSRHYNELCNHTRNGLVNRFKLSSPCCMSVQSVTLI